MSFFNLYALSVRDAQMGSPALRSDITDGFFKFSLLGGTHSVKTETTYSEVIGCLVVDDSIWEIYEGGTGDPILCHRATGEAYNVVSDVVITRSRDIFNIELVSGEEIATNNRLRGLKICEELNLQAIDIIRGCENA